MSLGEVDTLNLLSDKLNNLFEESQGYYESFLDTNNMYKEGKLTEREFFQKLGVYVVGFSFPVVPKNEARIRVQISASHSKKQLDIEMLKSS